MGIHDKCGALLQHQYGPMLICARSAGHTASTDEIRRRHYDPDKEVFWDKENAYDDSGSVIPAGGPRMTETKGRSE